MSPRFSVPRAVLVTPLAVIVALALPAAVFASLNLVKPDPAGAATFAGKGGVSSDGFGGGSGSIGTLQVDLPAASTIDRAYLYAAGTPSSTPAAVVDFAGQTVPMLVVEAGASGMVSRADVTSIVAAGVTSAGGVFDFAVAQPTGTEGVALVVTYANAAEPYRTIAVLDGAANPAGDSATFAFAQPIDPTVAGFEATLALGITFSYSADAPHACGSGQVSTVDVNGTRLSSCAGNWDDGLGENEALITVGGTGDSVANPIDPFGPGGDDDELYDIVPFMSVGDTAVQITSANPSNDDYIFLAVISVTAVAVVYGDGDPTPAPTAIPTPTPTVAPTPTPTPISTPTVAPTIVPTLAPVLDATPTPTGTATATATPAPSADAAGAPTDRVLTAPSPSADPSVGPITSPRADSLPNTALPTPSLVATPLAAVVAVLLAAVLAALSCIGWLAIGTAGPRTVTPGHTP